VIVFETIQKLIRTQGYASLSSIAQCSGLPKKVVLNILDANVSLLVRKGSKITGAKLFDPSEAIDNARASGRVFWQNKINYGIATELEWKNNPEADKLKTPYTCGGMGDSYTVMVLLDKPENRAKLEALGMVDKINPSEWPGFLKWSE
jgi:hypothetical protein